MNTMNTLRNFPKRYAKDPEPHGDQWLAAFNDALECVNKSGIVIMYGAHGTGKTRMAYEIARVCDPCDMTESLNGVGFNSAKKSRPCYYTTAMSFFTELKDSFRPDSETSSTKIMRTYTDAGLLVIDEVQERGETKFEDQKITAIIDARYMHDRPTILISNYSREQFASSLSPAVLDRIRENGIGINFNWTSYRRNGSV